jgi:hypothetical protein
VLQHEHDGAVEVLVDQRRQCHQQPAPQRQWIHDAITATIITAVTPP